MIVNMVKAVWVGVVEGSFVQKQNPEVQVMWVQIFSLTNSLSSLLGSVEMCFIEGLP